MRAWLRHLLVWLHAWMKKACMHDANLSFTAILVFIEKVVEDLIVEALELDPFTVPAAHPPQRGRGARRRITGGDPAGGLTDAGREVEHSGGAALRIHRAVIRARPPRPCRVCQAKPGRRHAPGHGSRQQTCPTDA